MVDATEPGWRPEYRGPDPSLGNVGSGKIFGANLYDLYRAGRNLLPELARNYAEQTTRIHGITGPMQSQFNLPGRGPTAAHRSLLELRDEVHEVLRQTSLRMAEVGAALVLTAERYTATDEAAVREFTRLLGGDDASDYQRPALDPPNPPAIGDPPPVDPTRRAGLGI
ncbi:hypothetical protein [Plantactinospora sonchi]|uniref:Uncharacterized protein n=1 Tax=Plantactinospora sonchi TaxID=1544735 RepID=A0ABU7RSM1_9ACTN